MSFHKREVLLGGPERISVELPLGEVMPSGNYAAGDSLAQLALGNFGLPLRHFLLRDAGGYVKLSWWDLHANGWEYSEAESIDLDVAKPVIFGNTGTVHTNGFREGTIVAQKLDEGIFFSPEQILFGVNLRENNVLQFITPTADIDGKLTYFSDTLELEGDRAADAAHINALGIDEVFLAALTPEQASQYINAVYRKVARFFHPEAEGSDEERMKKINTDAEDLLEKYGKKL